VMLMEALGEPLVHLALQRGAPLQASDAGVDGVPSTPVRLQGEFFACRACASWKACSRRVA
jgi:hypothetical protein